MNKEIQDKIWNYIKRTRVCMMTTLNQKHVMQSRPMHLVQNEFDGKLYFYTKVRSPKVKELHQEDRVSLTFTDSENSNYVSLYGTGKLVRDQKLIDKFWNPVIEAWFPEGKESDNCALIEVTIEKGEYWDGTDNSLEFFYEIIKSNIKDEKPDIGENRKFG